MTRLSSEARRQQMVDAALELLADTTLAELSTRSVARHLGLSQPALFRHFRSREALLVAVVGQARGRLGQVAQGLLEQPTDALARLEGVAMALAGYVQRNPGLPRLLFSDGSTDSVALRSALGQLLSMQRSLVAELIRQGQAEGQLDRRVEPAQAGLLFVGMLQALILNWQLGGRQGDLPSEVRPLMRLWLDGVRVRGDAPQPTAQGQAPVQDGISVLDLRPILASGRDPLDDVLVEVGRLRSGAALLLTAPFRPRPLLALLADRGHTIAARPLADGDWSVAVWVGGALPIAVLTECEPPEPLEAALVAAEALGPGDSWLGWLPRYPRLLVPQLKERGLVWTLAEAADSTALLHLRRPTQGPGVGP